MKRCAVLTIAIGIACAMAACGGVSDKTCTTNADCVEGLVCDGTGKCVEREPLTIVTQSLPDATVGVPYRVTLQAAGGIPDYEWSLDYKPEWMSVDMDSGELSGTPDAPGTDLVVGIKVTDKSAGTQSVTAQLLVSVFACVQGASLACFEVDAGKCMEGDQVCDGGEWGACTNLTHSSQMAHCGPDCGACDPAVSDDCHLGSCTCGGQQACSADQACCLQACVDVLTDDANCGACGTRCANDVKNTTNPHCEQGRCDYDTCDPAFLDVDEDRSNGCEAPRDLNNCRFAGESCEAVVQHATGLSCVLDPVSGDYRCDYQACELGYLDCLNGPHDGCETGVTNDNCAFCGDQCTDDGDGEECLLEQDDQQQPVYHCGCDQEDDCVSATHQCCNHRCVAQDADGYCGDCQTDCGSSDLGPRCVADYDHLCGCFEGSDCGALGDLCCGDACVPFSEENCGDCGRVCDAYADRGPVCDVDGGACYCQADRECNDYSGSNRVCSGEDLQARCSCHVLGSCLGGPFSQCCPGVGDACVNLMTDPANCGRCGVACENDDGCLAGRCGCAGPNPGPSVPCPNNSPATDCHEGLCYCGANPSGDGAPCPDGRFCCHGNSGGSAGPDDGPDEGCCWEKCGANEPGDCLY